MRLQVVESFGTDKVFLIPDKYLAANVGNKTDVEVLVWDGACEVHERFTAEELRDYRKIEPDVKIIAHPECPPEVVAEADFAGSTAHMINWVKTKQPEKVMMITECSMADNVASETPGVNFIRPCNLCPHMKRITLGKILDSLLEMKEEVVVDPVHRRQSTHRCRTDDQLENLTVRSRSATNETTSFRARTSFLGRTQIFTFRKTFHGRFGRGFCTCLSGQGCR